MSEPDIEYVHIGNIGVDTGQVVVGDPGYFEGFDPAGADQSGKDSDFDFSYSGACAASQHGGGEIGEFKHVPAAHAVVTRTAMGDGIFPVFQVWEDGKLVGLHVDLTMQFAK